LEGDMYFHAGENCPRAEDIVKELKKSQEVAEMEKYFGLVLYHKIAEDINEYLGFDKIDPEKLTIKKAKSILDIHRCNTFHRHNSPSIEEESLRLLKLLRHFYASKVTMLDDLVKSISASMLLSEFLNYTKAAALEKENAPKLIFYSAHDINIELLFRIFLHENTIRSEEKYNLIPFSSVLSIEVHKEDENNGNADSDDIYYVKLLFNDEPQEIKWCGGPVCSLEHFHQILDQHIVPNLENFCEI